MTPAEKETMAQAIDAAQFAAQALVDATQKVFPVGTTIAATMGRHRITGKVISSGGTWYHDPGTITVENLQTKRERRVSTRYAPHNIVIISRP